MKKDSLIEEATRDPAGTFDHPRHVLEHPELERGQKIEILRRWQYDANELAVASEEGMAGGEPALLDEVLEALAALEARPASDDTPHKQGGGM